MRRPANEESAAQSNVIISPIILIVNLSHGYRAYRSVMHQHRQSQSWVSRVSQRHASHLGTQAGSTVAAIDKVGGVDEAIALGSQTTTVQCRTPFHTRHAGRRHTCAIVMRSSGSCASTAFATIALVIVRSQSTSSDAGTNRFERSRWRSGRCS